MAIKTPAELKALIISAFTDNDTGDILPIAARGFLDDAVDSLVPAHGGSSVLDRLQWNATTGRFEPVSAVDTQYLVVTARDDFVTLQRALVGLLTLGGNEAAQPAIPAYVTTRFFSLATIGGVNTSGNDALLSDIWPPGEQPPFVWLVTPQAFSWLRRSRVTVSTRVNNSSGTLVEADVRFGRLPYRVEVDGVPFEVGRYRTSLARPVDAADTPDQAALRFEYGFAAPQAETPTVTRLDP